jgi:hypothetical protein
MNTSVMPRLAVRPYFRPGFTGRGKEKYMRLLVRLFAFAIGFILVTLGCDAANSFTSTKIKDLLNHPRDYENKDVTIYGTVTNATSLLVIKYFEIEDDTGTIKVITDKLLPAKGEKMRVAGRMAVVEIGTERWVVLHETGDAKNWDAGPSNFAATSRTTD